MHYQSVSKLFLSISISLLISCSKKEHANMIFGRIENLNNSWIYLQKITENGDVTIDSVKTSSDGSFEMHNPSKEADYYLLRTNPTNIIYLILQENESIEITGDGMNFEFTYAVKGSKDSERIREFRKHEKNLSDSLSIVFEKVHGSQPEKADSMGLILQGNYTKEMGNFSRNFIKNNLNSLVSLSATKYVDQYEDSLLLIELRDTLLKNMPSNKYVKEYKLLVDQLKILPPGSIAPEIAFKTPDGKDLSLSSFKGKVVLIDFWASWCSPCRRENPGLVALYNAYKGKDFEIFGVSLDENVANWKNAIQNDGIEWPQVSDLKRWESKVVSDYQFNAIPYNVLIGRDGKIIAKGIQSESLETAIAKAIRN